VWLIELAPVSDPAEVLSAALAALGLREQALLYTRGPAGTSAEEPPDALGRLLAALADRRALLVLDNCEHLVAAAARLAGRVLAACPQVRILATAQHEAGGRGAGRRRGQPARRGCGRPGATRGGLRDGCTAHRGHTDARDHD
jgi:predicted ATPase